MALITAARAVNSPTTGTQTLHTGPGVYQGATIRGDAAFTVRIWDNTSAAGTLLAVLQTGGAGCVIDQPPNGVFFQIGCTVEVVAGTVQGSVRL